MAKSNPELIKQAQ